LKNLEWNGSFWVKKTFGRKGINGRMRLNLGTLKEEGKQLRRQKNVAERTGICPYPSSLKVGRTLSRINFGVKSGQGINDNPGF